MPADVSQAELPRQVRAELRGLPKELAEQVGGFLIMAGRLIEEDPDQAYEFAEAARRRAARLPIVREAAAETAYAAGKYEVALSEFRAIRRMSGNHDVLPAMADCERALGKPQAALKLSREAKELPLDPAQQIEMIIVEAGARRDLGQDAEAARLLRAAVDDLRLTEPGRNAAARLRYAYADVLAYRGDEKAARDWFAAAADLDREQLTDAAERRDALDGVTIDFDLDEDDDDEQSGSGEPGGDDDHDSRGDQESGDGLEDGDDLEGADDFGDAGDHEDAGDHDDAGDHESVDDHEDAGDHDDSDDREGADDREDSAGDPEVGDDPGTDDDHDAIEAGDAAGDHEEADRPDGDR